MMEFSIQLARPVVSKLTNDTGYIKVYMLKSSKRASHSELLLNSKCPR